MSAPPSSFPRYPGTPGSNPSDRLLLELLDVRKSFGAVRALKGVSLDLRPGEVHALLGENGAGKSTLIKIVTGAHEPDGGTIRVQGREVAGLSPALAHKLGVACIYQQPSLFPDLTIAENIGLVLEPPSWARRIRWSDRTTRARELLSRVGSLLHPDTEVRNLSMPEQQLVEIAKALGAGARILIMDEPTASLTERETELLLKVIQQLRADGVGIIYISHRLSEIFQIADRVTVLRDGESVGTFGVSNPSGVHGTEDSLSMVASERQLIELMVGREVSHIYPDRGQDRGGLRLVVEGLASEELGLEDIRFELHAGEILGLAGLVGAGRTELARMLFGITPADRGRIRLWNGSALEQVRIESVAQAISLGMAYVPEDRRRHGVILEMSLTQNTSLSVLQRLFPRAWIHWKREESMTEEMIQRLSIKAQGPRALVQSLSGGNQQKVALARWLATDPRVLILDEPTQGVDVGAKSEIHHWIRRLADQGLAVLLISSDLPEVLGMSDRIGVMRHGRWVATLPGGSSAGDVMAAALGHGAEGNPSPGRTG